MYAPTCRCSVLEVTAMTWIGTWPSDETMSVDREPPGEQTVGIASIAVWVE